MLSNGHSPAAVDGKFRNPIYYACLRGDWRLVAVLRVCYLAPFGVEEVRGGFELFDDSLLTAAIEHDNIHVLMTLMLLNVPFSKHNQDIIVNSEQNCEDLFPSSIVRSFEMQKSRTFHLLISICFTHSIKVHDGMFQSILMNLKREYIVDKEFEKALGTETVIRRFTQAIDAMIIQNHVTPAAQILTESTIPNAEDIGFPIVRRSTAMNEDSQNNDITMTYTASVLRDATLKSEDRLSPSSKQAVNPNSANCSEYSSEAILMENENYDMITNSHSLIDHVVDSVSVGLDSKLTASEQSTSTIERDLETNASSLKNALSCGCFVETGAREEPEDAKIHPRSKSPVLKSDADEGSAIFSIDATDESVPLQISDEIIQASKNSSLTSNQIGEHDMPVKIIDLCSNTNGLSSSPVLRASDEHYRAKESLIITFDRFELDVDPENRNAEPAIAFQVQDVLPAVHVEDHIGNSFLNACKQGLDEVLISLVDGFSVESIFRSLSVAQGNPLHLAVQARSLSTIDILLKWRPTLVFEVDKDGGTPLHAACKINFHVALNKFLNSALSVTGILKSLDRDGNSCLTLAVKQGASECVELLARNEDDVMNSPSTSVPSALELSLTSPLYSVNTFMRLFNICSEQVLSNFRSSHDNGLLQVAVKYQRIHSVCAILRRMGDGSAQIRDATGRTAVEIASASSDKTIFNLLVKPPEAIAEPAHQPSLDVAERTFDSCFCEADLSKNYLLRSFPGGIQVTSGLIDRIHSCVRGETKGSGLLHLFQKMVSSGNAHLLGMPVFEFGPQKQCTCLHLAAGVNSLVCLQFILDNCSRSRQFIDLHNSDGMTACGVALTGGYTKCAMMLLMQGSRIVSKSASGTSTDSMKPKICNLLHICAKHCHDPTMMEHLLDASTTSNIFCLNESNQTLLHICAHVNNIHAFNAISTKVPYAICILINHRDDLGNTALHICSSSAGSLPLAQALIQSGCYTHLRNYDGDLPCDIASFMGNMDIAQLTRTFKCEELEFERRSDFRLLCDEHETKLVDLISHGKATDISTMCKSPFWMGSWLSFDFMTSLVCAEKAAEFKTAVALSNSGFCALTCPALVETLLEIMLKTRQMSITKSLDAILVGCSAEPSISTVSSFMLNNFPTFVHRIASDKTLEDVIYAWVVRYWTRLSVCDANGYNSIELACKSENIGFLNAIISQLEALKSNADTKSNRDAQMFCCMKNELFKALSSQTQKDRPFLDTISNTLVGNVVMKIASLISYKILLRNAPASQILECDLINQRHSTLVSFGMVDELFREAGFDVEMAQNLRDSFGRCLVTIACIAGKVASVAALLEKGFSTSVVDCKGLNILHHTVANHKNDVVYYIVQRFPLMLLELDSAGCCLLHHAVCNGTDDDCLSTLTLIRKIADNDVFMQLCIHADDSNTTAIEASFARGNYNSGTYLLQNVLVICGRFAANPIHIFDSFVKRYLTRTFKLISDFNALLGKFSVQASVQNSLMSFVKVFCPELPFPVEDDDVLQPQNVDSASQSLKTMESGLKSSSFFSGQWVCIEATFSEHFLVPNDTSLTKASLAQIFSSVYNDTAFSNYVRPSVSEALIAHSLRLNWILQDGVSLSDCEQAMSIHTELIRHFLILELLSSAFCYNIQAFCRHAHSQLRCPANLEQHKIEKNPTVSSPGNKISTVSAPAALELAIDSQMLNAVGIYPPISSLPETAELFEMVSMNRIEDIFSCITKSSKYLTMYLDVHKNTLAHAVAFFCCVQDVEKLIIAGLKFNVRNDSGQMPFHFACMAGRFEVAQACLRSFGFQKSDQIPVDSYGNSLLHFAALSLNEHCLSSVQQTYQIPWDLATTSQRQTALDLLLQMEVDPKQRVCGLLVKGEALAEACKSKLVSVQFALQSSLVTCCRLDSYAKAVCCVHAGADIRTYFALDADNGEHNFWNAIDVCAACNSVSVMKNIFENVENSVWMEAVKRINCNRRKNQQPAPLWVACKHSSLNALKFLLENGSNLLDENDAGLNIFSYCITTRCNEALLELLNFSSAFFSDLFLKNIILTADKTGLSCVECAIQARYPEPIRVIRQHLIATKACNEPDMIILGHKYITYLCQSRCILPSDPNSTFSCLMEIVYFFDEDAVQALMKMYQYDCHPLKSCSSAGAHDTAILVFILHVLARVDFNGQKLLHTDLDEPLDSMTILPRSGSTTIWNAFQLIERILPAFIGHEAWIQRYLSGHLGRFVVKLDDYCVDQFLKLLLSRNESVITSRDLWESFFSRARSSFNHICIRDTPIIEPYCSTNLTSEQNKLLDAIHRGDSLALNKIVSENPGVYLDPAQCGEFHNQCYVAAIVGDQEHMLDKLAQKGFQYSQQYGKENLIILASRLGRSKIMKSLSLMPHLNLDINHCTSDGMNALRVACARNHCETVQSLIINFPSIDVSAQNSLGESAVSLCIRHGHASALAIIIKCVGIQMFLSVVNENKQNVFHLAAVADNSSVFQVVCAVILKELDQTHVFGGKHPSQELLKSLVEVSRCAVRPEANDILFAALCAQDVNGDTPAHICIHSRSVAVLAVLLHACPIACLMPNASGSSPLHVVASRSCFSVDLFRLLVSAAKSLGQWIFDYQSRQQLLAENYGAQASLMAALCHFENVDGLTVWDVAFSENNDAQSYITKFISLCRMKNPQMPQISQLIGSSMLKTLFSDITAPSTYKRVPQKTRMGSIYLASICFLQNILRRSKLNRWYVMQIHRRIYEVKRRLVSSCLLQRNWRHHVSSQKMRAAKYFKMCCVRIQCCYRSMLCRRIFTLRKNLSHQVVRIERSRSIWTAYQRFVKRKSSVNIFQSIQEINAEYRHRCSISGALQLQAAVMSHHIYLLRKHHRKRTCIKSEFYAARTIQKVFRGREGRRLFSSLQQLSNQENFLTLPSGRKLHVQKYMMLHFIRRMQRAVRFLLAKRQVSVEYFSKNGLSACCIIQRAWFNHFCRVILRRSHVKQRESVLSAFACKIQKHIRGKLSRSSFMKSIELFRWSKSAITLQCAFRCTLALHIFRLRADRASFDAQRIRKIQDLRVFIENESLKSKRARVESQLLLLKGKAATVISSLIRGVILRCRKVLPLKRLERQSYELHRSKVRSAEKIQRAWFKHCALKTMHYLGWNFGANIQRLVAIRRIVSHLKIRTACTKYHAMRRYVAVVKLQNIWRIHQSHQQCQKIRFRLWKQQIHSHATKIKAVFIAHKVRLSFCSLKSKWPTMRETRISKKVLRQLFSNFQSSKFHKIVLKSLLTHKNMNVLMIQCAFRSKLARNTFRSVVSCHNMNIIEKRTRTLQRFWRRCLQEKLLRSKIPWMLFPWPSSDVHLEASSWSVSHAYDVRLESFMQSRQFDDYNKTLSAACQFGMRRLQEVPDEAAHALQSLVRFAASMSETALYHGNKDVAFSLASRAAKLLGTEKTKFVLNCRTELSAWVLDTLAHVFFSRGLFSHTLSLLNEAIISGGLRSSPDNSMLAILHFHKGLVYLKLGNTLSAKDNLLRACQMFRQHGDENYSLHLAAAQLALSSSLLPYDMGAAANHSFSAKDILSQFPTSAVHETFFPPSMCWRQTGLQRILRRIAMASGRFIRSALLKFKRSTIQTAGTALAHFGKSRPRRFFNRSHLFPQENESWARWSIQSVGAFGIIPEIPKIIMIENKNSHIYETGHRHILLDSGRFREKAVRKDNKRDELSAEQTGDMHSKLNKYFADLRTTPVLIHPFHAYETSTSNNSAFQDIQFLLSSCLDVKASPSSQQRWLKLLQSSSPDGQLPSFVRDLVTHAPIAAPQIQDSASSTVKQFCASPNPTPRKDIVSCLDRVMLYLLQRAHSLWASSDDERCSIDECKESVQLLKDMIDGTMNSLKHVLSKNWKYAIILCDAVLLALSSDYSEAFNHCMRVHDSLQKAQGIEERELYLRLLSSCNAVYCLWHFQNLATAEVSQNTTIALSELLYVDVKLAMKIGLTSVTISVSMFHNLAHIKVQTGEYLRAFSAWEEVHKAFETMSQQKTKYVQENPQSLTTRNSSLLKASLASIEDAISKWMSIKNILSSECRCVCKTFCSKAVMTRSFLQDFDRNTRYKGY